MSMLYDRLSGSEGRTVLLEVLLAGGGELDGNKLEAAVLEAGDNGANQAALRPSVAVTRP